MKRMRDSITDLYTEEAFHFGNVAEKLVKDAFYILIDAGYDSEDVTCWLYSSINMVNIDYHLNKQE